MKPSPDMEALENTLRSSKMVAHGFLGTDQRPLEEIIAADAAALARRGHTTAEVADRMQDITALAKTRLGAWVRLGDTLEAAVNDTRGALPCPWPHPGRFEKTVTTLHDKQTHTSVQWSMLNIHMIRAHGFFEGQGTPFRLDPETLLTLLFDRLPPQILRTAF